VQRFGSALNAHTHLHCCVTDGVFSLDPVGTLHFHPPLISMQPRSAPCSAGSAKYSAVGRTISLYRPVP